MKSIVISIIAGAVIIAGAILFIPKKEVSNTASNPPVAAINGDSQVIELTAKGGYTPQKITAKADTETVLQVTTNNTFDCSAALSIPELNYSTTLPPSGVTDIQIPPQKSGTTLQGLCVMGMYNFQIQFE